MRASDHSLFFGRILSTSCVCVIWCAACSGNTDNSSGAPSNVGSFGGGAVMSGGNSTSIGGGTAQIPNGPSGGQFSTGKTTQAQGVGGNAAVTGVGGKAGSGTGTSPIGGTGNQGGTTPSNGTGQTLREIPSMQIVKEMKLGWNLGNSLDADPTETGWGNPLTTKAMIDVVKSGGFNTVRIPVTWKNHIGAAPDYKVEEAWLARVEEVANYVLSNGMYAIVNTHHDEWVSVMPTADKAAIADKLAKLWTQIATRMMRYDEHLIFETLNEPRTTDDTQWNGGTAAARQIINEYNLAAVNAIRATGGNNAKRHIMIPTHAANASNTCVNDLKIPNDDPNIIVSLHTYYPYELSLGTGTTWGTDKDKADMVAELDRIYALLPKKGRAVVIGEWGTLNHDNTAVRVEHAGTYAKEVRARGMCPIWWDNGGFDSGGLGLLTRKANPPTWQFPEIVAALASGATAGAALAP